MVLGPPNWSSDFHQKLRVAGPAAFGENTFRKMTPRTIFLGKLKNPAIGVEIDIRLIHFHFEKLAIRKVYKSGNSN